MEAMELLLYIVMSVACYAAGIAAIVCAIMWPLQAIAVVVVGWVLARLYGFTGFTPNYK